MFPFTLKPDFLNYLLIYLHNIEVPIYGIFVFSKINVENNEVHTRFYTKGNVSNFS